MKRNKSKNVVVDETAGGVVDETAGGVVDETAGGVVDETAGGVVDETAGGVVDETAGGVVDETAGGVVDETAGGVVDETAGGVVDETAGGDGDGVGDEVEVVHRTVGGDGDGVGDVGKWSPLNGCLDVVEGALRHALDPSAGPELRLFAQWTIELALGDGSLCEFAWFPSSGMARITGRCKATAKRPVAVLKLAARRRWGPGHRWLLEEAPDTSYEDAMGQALEWLPYEAAVAAVTSKGYTRSDGRAAWMLRCPAWRGWGKKPA